VRRYLRSYSLLGHPGSNSSLPTTRNDEKFDNVRIDTDGEVAQVWFDYVFKRGDYAANWGKEAWQLVRTDAGGKIVSIIWSTENANTRGRILGNSSADLDDVPGVHGCGDRRRNS
jgi:hypothetical protein